MTVSEIKSAIRQLRPQEITHLASWLADYDHALWDKQIAKDFEAGRLDNLLREVDIAVKQGRTRPL
ncbi:hypothetical protein J2I47_20135 [Fibrella sp. HMF5335]|uniref:Uncharacterized protein n=1 Tax=Fibrella rubiginis TaxID=2817060 RepID=A0A939K6I6_9BACT|nr:hypothetical protein [Fibrella rubiginis]MBO0938873.1 hypothetical protein [Fibrella rubiginis]